MFNAAWGDRTRMRRPSSPLSQPQAVAAFFTLSMSSRKAAREFGQIELADHKYVMVLHDHQANPHVHISVRAESKHGKRLNPRKADLHRWRVGSICRKVVYMMASKCRPENGGRSRQRGARTLSDQASAVCGKSSGRWRS